AVFTVTPNHGPDSGNTPVTITGTGFQVGATVIIGDIPATLITVVSATTITCTTSAHVAAIVDVKVRNPDFQSGVLEQGYAYDGWWEFGDWPDFSITDPHFPVNDHPPLDPMPPFVWTPPGPIDPFSFTWYVHLPQIPGRGWHVVGGDTPPPVDGWWLSMVGYGGTTLVVAEARPKDPRTWAQISAFATGSATMLGGSPGIAAVLHNRMIYPASNYVVGTDYPPLRIYDGAFDR